MVTNIEQRLYAIVPAAGIGSRMKAEIPKQYLQLLEKTILEHTVEKLLEHPQIQNVIVAVSPNDPYFPQLKIANHPKVIRVDGGGERADSVLSGLARLLEIDPESWVLVHDAARPCISISDIDALIKQVSKNKLGGILAAPVRDTMKRGNGEGAISVTVDRQDLWHALTPQMFNSHQLHEALIKAKQANATITDEASAMEWLGRQPQLVPGRMDNLKITQPEDLALAEFYLRKEQKEQR
ncbi:2-C-methyl-D-erythritol 4-phosphate cytidylyltransferase [Vibrio sp. 99-8-1]|uniref:2-C-methyl-D-erythritol 4-phosphate cytidylyltransferase n=1 Tax=Vibrio sp. 99-8-1 TaxID=2607602 RepID=UPI00149352B2|nr:2-C-methyl-D-erythritol 4-phosphate cytidylyltransferase [Vibrio sp. 99-8-1]NOI67315.1 2-C-methyl-D-erythritol 4-phosphate cytidylyltransferase [Vibrio sp. 99-8-1]